MKICTLVISVFLSMALPGVISAQRVLNGNPNWTVVSSQFAPDPSTCLAVPEVGNIYIQTQNPNNGPTRVLYCTQTGPGKFTWQPIDHHVYDVLPAKCAIGQVSFLSSAPAGQNLYGCTAVNTWTLLSGGSGGATSFNAILPGTNTSALVVGDGGTLTATGTGEIVATRAGTLTAAIGQPVGTYCTQIVDAAGTITYTQNGCPGTGGGGGGGGTTALSFLALTNAQFLGMTNAQYLAMTN